MYHFFKTVITLVVLAGLSLGLLFIAEHCLPDTRSNDSENTTCTVRNITKDALLNLFTGAINKIN